MESEKTGLSQQDLEKTAQAAPEEQEKEKNPEDARGFITIGDKDPRQMGEDVFKQEASLFHASKKQDFHVDEGFDYIGADEVEGVTLGRGLYVTANRERADGYANLRAIGQGKVFELLPYQARLLDLRRNDSERNASFPSDLLDQWINFAQTHIPQKIEDLKHRTEGNRFALNANIRRLQSMLYQLDELKTLEYVDLREHILGTGELPYSPVESIWKDFCTTVLHIDGIIYREGGEGTFANEADATYAFYNLAKVGTYSDWQRRASHELSPREENELAKIRETLG